MERAPKKYEEYAYILDELRHGRPGAPRTAYHGQSIIQMVGETYFTLLEAVPRSDIPVNIRDRIYVGKKGRTTVEHILGRIAYGDLSSGAKAELPNVVETIVNSDVPRFIAFFNESQSVTPRMHAMERVPFDTYDDLKSRVNVTDPAKLLARRVLKELSEDEKYQIFTRPI